MSEEGYKPTLGDSINSTDSLVELDALATHREDLRMTEEALSSLRGENWKGRSRNFVDTLMGTITPEMREEMILNLEENKNRIAKEIEKLELNK